MNASDLIGLLSTRGLARPRPNRPGIIRVVAVGPIEIAEAEHANETFMRARWKERAGTTGTPCLIIADEPRDRGRVRVLGPTLGNRPILSVDPELLADVLRQVSNLSPFEAVRRLADDLTRIGGDGLTVRDLLTRHTLEHRFGRDASRWDAATELVQTVRPTDSWRQVLRKLGYTLQQLPNRGHLARYKGRPVVVIHPKAAARDLARVDAQGRPPEGLLLSDCDAQGAAYGILVQGTRYRLFDAGAAAPASQWLELDIHLLGGERFPFLALLAPPYLAEDGFGAVRREARAFGVELHKRLDRTIRQDALPALAAGMQAWARTQGMDVADDSERLQLERAALTLVFRIVFILFCESAGHLPMGNRNYEKVSLSSLVREAHDTIDKLSPASTALWTGLVRLVRAMRDGNPAWDVPAYNGELFASRDFVGAELLERLELRDPVFAKVLVSIGQDQETRRGADFSTLEIAHIGHTYESLLSLQLSLARRPLRYDARQDRYVEATPDDAEVTTGGLLWQTHQGGRKAGGVYYTPVEIVRHLVQRAVLPAYERHLDEVGEIGRTDPDRAARHLLSFAVVDPACGSAHFLVQVAETLAERTVRFLADHPLPPIVDALERLRRGATTGVEADDVSLLRRLLVKNCVFGVDASPMGAEVATLSLWLASFVPGLSLSYLGRNVRVGDSLIGVADPNTVVAEGSIFIDALGAQMRAATDIVREMAEIDDRTPAEVAASQVADQRATRTTAGLERFFDLWTAEQFGVAGAREHAEHHSGAVIEGTDVDGGTLVGQAHKLAARHRFLHWPLAFPQVFSRARPGFDVVVGNPPWEEVTVEELSFYGMYRPGINSLREPERSRVIAELVRERPELPTFLRQRQETLQFTRDALACGDFKPMGSDPDLYKYFCQRYRVLVRDTGFVGVVLPRTAFNAKGSAGFREWLYEGTTTHRIDFIVNTKGWAFSDVTPKYTIALVVAERSPPTGGHRVEILGTAGSAPQWARQSATRGVCAARSAFGAGWETPLLRTQDEADLLSRLRAGNRFPLGAGGRWSCFPVAELHETKDKRFWKDYAEGQPLWKGESFDQYDPGGAGERACPVTGSLLKKVRKPRPGLKSLLAQDYSVATRQKAVRTELDRARVAFRDVARGTDPRTIIACLIPPGVFLTNKAPYLAFVNGDPAEQAACLGIMNSLPFDWQARRFIEINVNFFLLEGLYLPDLGDDDFRAISRAAARLSAVDDRFADFAAETGVECGRLGPAERIWLRAEIDARVARAWGLSAAELEVVFRDFTEAAVTPAYRAAMMERLEELI